MSSFRSCLPEIAPPKVGRVWLTAVLRILGRMSPGEGDPTTREFSAGTER